MYAFLAEYQKWQVLKSIKIQTEGLAQCMLSWWSTKNASFTQHKNTDWKVVTLSQQSTRNASFAQCKNTDWRVVKTHGKHVDHIFFIKTWTNSYISQYIIISVCSLAPENIFWLNLCLQTSCNKSSVHTHTTYCPHSHNVLSTLTQWTVRQLHTILQYTVHLHSNNTSNTPSVFTEHIQQWFVMWN